MKRTVRKAAIGILAAAFALTVTGGTVTPAFAADPGLTDTEIVLGGTHPFSGPASAYGNIGKGIGAYFEYVNDHGGVNGRKIKWIDKDDGYSPPQAVQLVHQMVEQDHVFAIFDTLGTAVNTALRPYLNQNNIPHLFVATGATTWGKDYQKFPWTIGWQPDYQAEAVLYAQDVLREHPKAKIGVIYQNDDYGEDMNTGLKKGLGSHQNMIVKMASYETSDPNVSSQISTLKAAGCDTLMIFATPKFAIQSMVAAAQQSWKPVTYLNNVANAIPYMRAAAKAGGPSAVAGIITTYYLKDPANHSRYAGDKGMKLYEDIMTKYIPSGDKEDGNYLYGVSIAYTMVDVLKKAGRDLTRKKVMDVAANFTEKDNPLVYPGVVIRTSPNFRFPITQMITAKWLGTDWSPTGLLVDTRSTTTAATK
ncbi:MAG: branched-chain amino acid transport system substrate-binding protein [Candidatus Eremiobacteraeota bacterium]|nr:branched-chain amino acid transport system substrate-binding protein [Candidatus Eremiobacteraeota bacterium]